MRNAPMDEGQVLESWKEIAAFLGRDVRTCTRWERELGLPIHRLEGSPKARVFAFREELEAWLQTKLHEHDGEHGPAAVPSSAWPFLRRLALKLGLIRLVPPSPAAPPRSTPSAAPTAGPVPPGTRPGPSPTRPSSAAPHIRVPPRSSRAARVSFRPRFFVVTAVPALAAAALAYRAFVPGPPPALTPAYIPPVLAVLTFENKSGDPALDHWRDSLTELVAAQLSQSRYIRVITTDQMLTALRRLGLADAPAFSSDEIARIALSTHAGHVLRGSFVKAGPAMVITVGVQHVSPVRPASPVFKVVARSDFDVIAKADRLARAVKRSLRLTRSQIAYDPAREAGEVVTPSPQALRFYVEGRRAQLANRWEDAVTALEQAIAEDPGFAMAHRALGVTLRDLDRYPESRAAIDKCLARPDRLPPGEDRFIRAQSAFFDQDYAAAIPLLREFLAEHPGHAHATWYLAAAYGAVGDLDRAIELETVVAGERNSVLDVRTLALYLQRQGRYQEAADLCLSFLRNVEEAWNVREMLVSCYVFLGELDLAVAEARQNFRDRPDAVRHFADTTRSMAEALIFKGDLGAAEAAGGPRMAALVRGQFAAHVEDRRNAVGTALNGGRGQEMVGALWWLARGLEKAGRYAEAWAAFEGYLKLAGPVGAGNETVTATGTGFPYFPSQRKQDLLFKARLEVESGRIEAAERTAAELRSVVDAGIVARDTRFHDYVLGLIDLAKGDATAAADHLQRACFLLHYEDHLEYDDEPAPYYDGLGRARFEAGDLEGARQAYERITRLTTGRRNDGDIYARAFYWLGRIAERKGEGAEARRYFRKFLALWKDADAGLPEVADAVSRIK